MISLVPTPSALSSRPAKEAGRRITAGEDKAYDTTDHAAKLRTITSRRM
jgi:hypothetical protein